MRRPFTTAEAACSGISKEALKWAVKTGSMQRVLRGVYIRGVEPPTAIELALAYVVGTDGAASHTLAGKLFELDSVQLSKPYVTTATRKRRDDAIRHRLLCADRLTSVHGYLCTNGICSCPNIAYELIRQSRIVRTTKLVKRHVRKFDGFDRTLVTQHLQ